MGRYQHHCRREPRAGRRRTKRLLMIRIPDHASQDDDHGVGDFRAPNLVAILRAVPQTDGTCSAVASKAREYGSTVTRVDAGRVDPGGQRGPDRRRHGDRFRTVRRCLRRTEETTKRQSRL